MIKSGRYTTVAVINVLAIHNYQYWLIWKSDRNGCYGLVLTTIMMRTGNLKIISDRQSLIKDDCKSRFNSTSIIGVVIKHLIAVPEI